jgi:adhesin HecA-like repeat protein
LQPPAARDDNALVVSLSPSQARRSIRRVLLALLAAAALLEAVYVGAGVYLVRSGQVERWINKRPEKLRVSFDSAFTIVPGVVHFRNLRIVQQGRGSQLEGVVDRGWGIVDLAELPLRRIHVVGLRAEGVAFRLRKRPRTPEEAQAPVPAEVAPIEGVPWEPYSGPLPGPRRAATGWTVVFTRTRLEHVREVWIHVRRLKGSGTVTASVTVGRDRRVSIRAVDARFDDASLDVADRPAFSSLQFHLRGNMRTFDPKQTKGLALLGLVRADLDVTGRIPSAADLLDYYLRGAPWVRCSGGEALLSAHLGLAGGRLAPGGVVELAPTDLRASFGGFAAQGRASTRLDVLDAAAGPEARLTVAFESYGLLRSETATEPVLRGRGLRIDALSPASLQILPPQDFAGRIDLGQAELPELGFVNELLPGGAGVRVKEGSARVEGAFDVSDSGRSCTGSMRVTGGRLVFDAGGVRTAGSFTFSLAVPRGDLIASSFGVDGTRLDLEHFSFAVGGGRVSAPDWSGRIAFPEAALDMSQALTLEGQVELRTSDTRPLVAFLSADKPLKGWKKRLLTIGEIEGGGRFRLGGQQLAVDGFRVSGGPVEVQARARVTDKGAFGKVLARYGVLKAGIELKGRDRALRLFRPERWYRGR